MAYFDQIMLPVKKPEGGVLTPLYQDEIILGTFRDCDLLDCHREGTPYKSGLAVVSSHNVYWHSHNLETVIRLELLGVSRIETHNSIFRRTHRCDIFLSSPPFADKSLPGLSVTFGQKNSSDFKRLIETSLERELWNNANTLVNNLDPTVQSLKSRAPGVAGIIQRQREQRDRAKEVADEAFADLDSLMKAAQTLVHLVERYADEIDKDGPKRNQEEKETAEFYNMLNDIGIANPATKTKCGSSYHSSLAFELSDYLERYLKRHSSTDMMALTDLYCVFNRARGTELISPNDLYQACSMLPTLKLPFKLRKFDSGAIVIQSTHLSDEVIVEKVSRMLQDNDIQFLTNTYIAKKLSMSLTMADEYLIVAEKSLVLCRDETAHETRFYSNRFSSFVGRHE
mmetsp:Transcript_11631/g.14082  ORF Transcript_11631/g.14082 Transcript_11631/m.14082 type:complete len:398 (+) Transcript_11631:110-1303(+)|eukprot:CAMPEP_0184015732 /NCGR_PEP_ID=MMETSP0954-20121128/6508_1 /TAXON_ID=627963 /ORGANISM="Aplanochytrium sp, Strain PBS07" /LENGTH=397 /DNA_ID=CAMNT_0026296617 /DNA_START=193 /DNA_END=1386 /DNA_ORIENTATION=+